MKTLADHDAMRESSAEPLEPESPARGMSNGMDHVFAVVRKVAPLDVTALISGETGTGKELIARTIHRLSPRSARSFVAFSCANLPENLADDQLFGHERGAFTDAVTDRKGRFETADGGTLFLDEIGDLDLTLQAKLLRVLQERSFERLGGGETIKVDVRLVCATHRDLRTMVEQATFREDLYHRLNVVEIRLPPLRARRSSIGLLAEHILDRAAKEFGKPPLYFSESALNALEEYDWPGNVRELENVIQRGVVLTDGPSVDLQHLPAALGCEFRPALGNSYADQLHEFRRRLILRTLRRCNGNKAEAARELGLARGYLHRLLDELDLRGQEFRDDSRHE